MKRTISFVLFTVFLMLFSTNLFSAKVTLSYAMWDANQKPGMEASIKEFMKQKPNIEVKIEVTEWNDYWTKITTGVASGTMPDVFWGHLAYLSGLITKGALMDLTPNIKKDKVDLSIYYQNLLECWKYQGKQYGIPKDWDTICVFYNKDLLDKIKEKYPDEKWSWNTKDGGDFLKLLQKLTFDESGKNAVQKGFDKNKIALFGLGGVQSNNAQQTWMNFIWMNGGKGILDKPYGNKFVMDDPKAVDALQFWGDLATKYTVAPLPAGTNSSVSNYWDLFSSGKVAMVFEGSWMISAAKTLKFNWDIAPLPKGPNGRVSAFNGLAHVVAAKTKYPNEAWKLAKWMDSYESQKIIAKYGSAFPAIGKLMPEYLAGLKGSQKFKYFSDETANTGLMPMHVNWAQMNDMIIREIDMIFSGSESAKDGVKNIKDQITPLL